MSTRSAPRAMLLPALAIIAVTVGGCGASGSHAGSSSPAATAATATAPTADTVAPSPTAPPPAATASPAAGAPIDFTGYVQQVDSTGNFLVDNGQVSYTVVMSPTTAVVNLRGRQITRLFIRVTASVQVTGMLSDSTINAQTVLIPTRKDIPDG